MSVFVECESAAELERAFGRLAEGGSALMPVGNFGVSWQLNLA